MVSIQGMGRTEVSDHLNIQILLEFIFLKNLESIGIYLESIFLKTPYSIGIYRNLSGIYFPVI